MLDLSALQFSSKLGVGGIFFTFLFHALRLIDGKYAHGSKFLATMSAKAQPSWPTPKFSLWNVNQGTLVLVNMLCVGFLAHYNAINYYKELSNSTPKRYQTAIVSGFSIAMTVFSGMMIIGYSLFGNQVQPLILNNFHRTDDVLATCARFATGLAIISAYPLMFAALKSSLYTLLPTGAGAASGVKANANSNSKQSASAMHQSTVSSPSSTTVKQAAVVTALAAITSIAFKCSEDDVSIVLGIVGSVLGCGVGYILPAVLKLSHMRIRKRAGLKNGVAEVAVNHLLVMIGLVFGAMGVWITLQTAGQHSHDH